MFSDFTYLDADDLVLDYFVKSVERTKNGITTISTALPRWMIFISEQRVFMGLPNLDDLNVGYKIFITIIDSAYEFDDSFELSIPNRSPVLNSFSQTF